MQFLRVGMDFIASRKGVSWTNALIHIGMLTGTQLWERGMEGMRTTEAQSNSDDGKHALSVSAALDRCGYALLMLAHACSRSSPTSRTRSSQSRVYSVSTKGRSSGSMRTKPCVRDSFPPCFATSHAIPAETRAGKIFRAWPDVPVDTIKTEALKRQSTEGWDAARAALETTVRCSYYLKPHLLLTDTVGPIPVRTSWPGISRTR